VQEEFVEGLHSPARQLIELRMRHAELDAEIDAMGATPADDLLLRRKKKARLALRDQVATLEANLSPPELA
jgi:hypothetical protein